VPQSIPHGLKHFPFYLTETEVRCADEVTFPYCLYRVFEFARPSCVFALAEPLRGELRLEPVQYRAGIGPGNEGEDGARGRPQAG
jgi:hypothetical protein